MIKHFAAIVLGREISRHASFDAANRAINRECVREGINPYSLFSSCGSEPITAAAARYMDRIGQIDSLENAAALREDKDETPVDAQYLAFWRKGVLGFKDEFLGRRD